MPRAALRTPVIARSHADYRNIDNLNFLESTGVAEFCRFLLLMRHSLHKKNGLGEFSDRLARAAALVSQPQVGLLFC
jgi:hypothetical protein